MAVPSTIPVFFKIFNPDMSSHRLQIPSCFTSYMKGKLPNSTTSLRDRCGIVWHVEVAREGNNLYFENGWLNFVEDNGFERGDILVFQFNGDCFFNFKHYNKTACENGVIGFFNFTAKEEEEQVCKVEDDREEDEEGEDVKVKKIKMTVPEKEFESSSIRVKKDTVPKKEFESSSARVEKDATARSKEKAVVKDEGGLENNVNEVDRRRGVDIFKSGQIAPPKNPYFISRVKQMKRNELSIPVEVIRDHNLEITGEIIIRGEDGKEFHSRINTWGDGRKRVTDGWRAFCRWNFVKEEDTCLCEFRTSNKLVSY